MEKYLGLISFLLSFILVFTLILPKYQSLTQLKKEISEMKVTFETQEKYFSELEKISNQLKDYQENLAKIDSALPKDSEIPPFLNFIQKTASQSGLSLKGIKLVSTSSQKAGFKENKIGFVLGGNYPALENFLSVLEKSARLIEVEQISFSLTEEGSPADFNLTVKVYSY